MATIKSASGTELATPQDEAAIKTVIESVATLADRGDFEPLAGLFADEFWLDWSSVNDQPADVKSPSGLMGEWAAVLPGFDRTRHQVSNIAVTVNDQIAKARADMVVRHWLDDAFWEVTGRCDYELAQEERDWKIISMTFTLMGEKGSRRVIDAAIAAAADDPPALIIRQETKKAVLDFLEALEAFDIERAMAVFADDAVLDLPRPPEQGPAQLVGKEAITEFYKNWLGVLRAPDLTSALRFHPMRDAQMTFTEGWFRTRSITSGPVHQQPCAGLFHVEDGKITLYRAYIDPRPVTNAAGFQEV